MRKILLFMFVVASLCQGTLAQEPFKGTWSEIHIVDGVKTYYGFSAYIDVEVDGVMKREVRFDHDDSHELGELFGYFIFEDRKVLFEPVIKELPEGYHFCEEADIYTLYDFTHVNEPGDFFAFSCEDAEVHINAIDEIPWGVGTTKRYHLGDPHYGDYCIEGMGCTGGLFSPIIYHENMDTTIEVVEFSYGNTILYQKPYRSYFGEEYTKWYTLYEFYDVDKYSSRITVGNEEEILPNGLTYRAAYYSVAHSPEKEPVFYQYMREDRETGGLFIYVEGEEILVSTMNLEKGDKFYFPPYIINYYFRELYEDDKGYYTIVDSVYYENGRKHIRCEAIYDYFRWAQLVFIEGIGPSISFDPFHHIHEGSANCLICYETESDYWETDIEWYYGEPEDKDCFFNEPVNIDEIEKNSSFLYPTLVKDRIDTGLAQEANSYRIFSTEGRKVREGVIESNHIKVNSLAKGVYLIILYNKQGEQVTSQRIIKQ